MICGIHFNLGSVVVEDGVAAVQTEAGVDYEIKVPFSTLHNSIGYLSIYHHIYDRGQALYGFLESKDRALFKNLISVQGVGCSVAIKLMSSYSSDKIRIDIADGDFEDLSKAKGIGKGTAKKIVETLKSRYMSYRSEGEIGVISAKVDEKKETADKINLTRDLATKALIKLGFSTNDAKNRVHKVWHSAHSEYFADRGPHDINMDLVLRDLIVNALKS